MDVCGPLEETSRGGARYLATFLDDFSKLSTVEPVAQKSEVGDKSQGGVSKARDSDWTEASESAHRPRW